jgi:hypothetical protein
METQPRQSCAARMLDIRSYVIAARRSMAGAEPAAALFMIATFGLIALVLTPMWVSFDLLSTWDFTTGLRLASEDAIYDAASYAEGMLRMSVGSLLVGIIFTGFTLLPSLFELAFPTVSHPLLNLILWASIVFDYITDWGKAAGVADNWTNNPALAFVYTALFCAFVSVFIQALLVLCITVVIFGLLTLIQGGSRQAQAVVIDSR